jgi:hypothetical protein
MDSQSSPVVSHVSSCAPNSICPKCRNIVLDSGKSVECDLCRVWFHLECVGINNTEFRSLAKTNTELCWICIACKTKPRTSGTATTYPGSVDNKLDSILGLLGDMNSRIGNLESHNMTRDKEIDTKIDEKVHDAVREELDKERRKLNLIVHGLEESINPDADTRKQDEMTGVQSVMSAIKLDNQQPTDITRLGETKPGKIRPMRITVRTLSEKRSIMANAKLLRLNKDLSKN